MSAPLWVSYALWAVMEVLLLTGLVLSCTALIAGLRGTDRPNVDAVVRDRRLHAGLALVAVALALSWSLWWGGRRGRRRRRDAEIGEHCPSGRAHRHPNRAHERKGERVMGDIGRERRHIVVRPLTEPVLARGTSLTHRAAGDGRQPLLRSRLALVLAGVWAMR